MVWKHFTEENKDLIQEKFDYANNINNRVDGAHIKKTITMVQNVIENYTAFYSFVDKKVFHHTTSVVHRITKAVNRFINASKVEIKDKYFKDMQVYIDTYLQSTEPRVHSLQTAFDNAMSVMVLLNTALELRIKTTPSSDPSFWDHLPRQVREEVNKAFISYEVYNELEKQNGAQSNVPNIGNLTADVGQQRSCDQFSLILSKTLDDLNEFIDDIEQDIDTYKSQEDLSKSHIKEIEDGLKDLTKSYRGMKALRTCISGYGDFLHYLQYWEPTLDFNLTDRGEVDIDDFYHKYSVTQQWLKDILQDYSRNKISKHQLALELLSANTSDIIDQVSELIDSYKTELYTDLQSKIEEKAALMNKQYKDALKNLAKLESFFTSGKFTSLGKSINLWLKPYPVLESPKVNFTMLMIDNLVLVVVLYRHEHPKNG